MQDDDYPIALDTLYSAVAWKRWCLPSGLGWQVKAQRDWSITKHLWSW